jgi:hypothetical protein
MKAKRKTNDYIFCSVEFSESGKSYYYITEDDTLKIGDDVLVPVGNDGRTAIVKIINIEYFPEDKVPFPLEKAKSIIGKCTEDELNPPILNDETSGNDEMYSDNWLKQGYTSGSRIKVSEIVAYHIWSDNKGIAVGVTVDFEVADDFHYELLTEDWHRFLFEVLCIADMSAAITVFQGFLKRNTNLFAFEEALNEHGIKYKKIAFY